MLSNQKGIKTTHLSVENICVKYISDTNDLFKLDVIIFIRYNLFTIGWYLCGGLRNSCIQWLMCSQTVRGSCGWSLHYFNHSEILWVELKLFQPFRDLVGWVKKNFTTQLLCRWRFYNLDHSEIKPLRTFVQRSSRWI